MLQRQGQDFPFNPTISCKKPTMVIFSWLFLENNICLRSCIHSHDLGFLLFHNLLLYQCGRSSPACPGVHGILGPTRISKILILEVTEKHSRLYVLADQMLLSSSQNRSPGWYTSLANSWFYLKPVTVLSSLSHTTWVVGIHVRKYVDDLVWKSIDYFDARCRMPSQNPRN